MWTRNTNIPRDDAAHIRETSRSLDTGKNKGTMSFLSETLYTHPIAITTSNPHDNRDHMDGMPIPITTKNMNQRQTWQTILQWNKSPKEGRTREKRNKIPIENRLHEIQTQKPELCHRKQNSRKRSQHYHQKTPTVLTKKRTRSHTPPPTKRLCLRGHNIPKSHAKKEQITPQEETPRESKSTGSPETKKQNGRANHPYRQKPETHGT